MYSLGNQENRLSLCKGIIAIRLLLAVIGGCVVIAFFLGLQ